MTEKISDRPIREEKVKRLKAKILKDIDKEINFSKYIMKNYLNNDKDIDYLIQRIFVLIKLKEYIKKENTFMQYGKQYFDKDIIIYTMPDKNIDMWLEDDFDFVFRFLCKADELNYDVSHILHDRYFNYEFMSIIETYLYDKKMKAAQEIRSKI